MELLDEESSRYDYSFMIVLLGKSLVGKSILSSRLNSKSYFEFKKKILHIMCQLLAFNLLQRI